jgi:hypothetical protein
MCDAAVEQIATAIRELCSAEQPERKGGTNSKINIFYNPILLAISTSKKKSKAIPVTGPPRWSSGQSYWLQIRRPGFDSRQYQKKEYWIWNGVHSA